MTILSSTHTHVKNHHIWLQNNMQESTMFDVSDVTKLDVKQHDSIWMGLCCNRIEKMWVRDEAAYFFGPIFIHPEETEHEPTKMFYKKEVFLSNLEETCPVTCIGGNLKFHH